MANRTLIDNVRQSDPVLADKLAGQSQAVLTLLREDMRKDAGDNVIGRVTGGLLSKVLS